MRIKSLLPLPVFLGLLAAMLAPIQSAQAQSVVQSVPAPFVNYYADKASAKQVTSQTSLPFKHDVAKTDFTITWNTITDEMKPAIQAAIDVWASNFPSTVPVHVDASLIRQSTYSGVLASASAGRFFHGFKGSPDPDLWYSAAQANALAGKDLDPANPEIIIHINSGMARSFYLGTDGLAPTSQYDLESILIHELAHGLGFLSNDSYDPFFGYGSIDQPTPYDAYSELPDGRRLSDLPSPSIELGKALSNTLVWSGKNGIAANGGVKPKLYTPNPYQNGSSISHLDERTFSASGENSVMTPNLMAGEVFHTPGPLLLAMMADMLLKPPAGAPSGTPQAPRNVKALIGDKSAIVTFDAPANARQSGVTSYKVTVNETKQSFTSNQSPITATGLTNGTSYSFSVTASNGIATSDSATTNAITPQATWRSTVIDTADSKHLVTGVYAAKPYVIYSDSTNGDLKFAQLNGTRWVITTIDGNSLVGGKTKNDVSGYISACSATINKVETLHIFYADVTDKDLRHASFNGKKWSYEVVDGNGSAVNDYKDPIRVRTSSDVSASSACSYGTNGLQVFYRDESQGILLGATLLKTKWNYELVDGDRDTEGRTTGDVAFHLNAQTIGRTVYLTYDSVLQVNQDKKALRGDVRQAVRNTIYPEDWSYSTLQTTANGVTVAGFDVAGNLLKSKLSTAWLTASGASLPNADGVQYTSGATIKSVSLNSFGNPTSPLASDGSMVLVGCSTRLCAINQSDQTISLISTGDFSTSAQAAWLMIAGKKYAVAGLDGKLQLFKNG